MKKLLVDEFTTVIACPTGSFRVLVYQAGHRPSRRAETPPQHLKLLGVRRSGDGRGCGVYAAGHGMALPLLRIQKPPWRLPQAAFAWEFVSHLLFGLALELGHRSASQVLAVRSSASSPAEDGTAIRVYRRSFIGSTARRPTQERERGLPRSSVKACVVRATSGRAG